MVKFIHNQRAFRIVFILWIIGTVMATVLIQGAVGMAFGLLGGFVLMYWAYYVGIELPTRVLIDNPGIKSETQLRDHIQKLIEK